MCYNDAINVRASGTGFKDSVPEVDRAGRGDTAALRIGIVEADGTIGDCPGAVNSTAIVTGVVAANRAVAHGG